MRQGLYKFCVSTIEEGPKIRDFVSKGVGEFTEQKAWETGKVLFLESLQIGTKMPVILSDSAYNTEKLLCWATLQKVEIDSDRTTVKFDGVKKIRGNHQRQELILRSSNSRIAAHFIRPYAICCTPEFLE